MPGLQAPTPSGVFNEHEGFATDYDRWLEPDGTLRGILLFVAFENADGSTAEPRTSRTRSARCCRLGALSLYTDLGMPEAEQVRAQLDALRAR